jgi:putative transcriptional regulator
MERIGLACVRVLPEQQMNRGAPVGRLGAHEALNESADGAARIGGDVPVPLRKLLGTYLDDVRWGRLGPGVWHHPLPLSNGTSGDLRLLRVAAGRAMPEHGHGGAELTLMLRGVYNDRFGRFATGDIADLDADVVHRPVVEAGEDCICLVASEQKARFKGLISRLVQPLTGM